MPDSAFAALSDLKNKLTPEQYRIQENRLRVALEDQGQQVILRYLTGDQIPQTQKDFQRGDSYYRAAKLLTPESLFLEGQGSFMRGRAMLFDKNYKQAADLLEDAVRIDPGGAHAYNALGIAYLEQADYARAIPAFRDAAHRAQHWTYPLHNLALCYMETGDSAAAIRTYQQAIRADAALFLSPVQFGTGVSAAESAQGCGGLVSARRLRSRRIWPSRTTRWDRSRLRPANGRRRSSSIVRRSIRIRNCSRLATIWRYCSRARSRVWRRRSICGGTICKRNPDYLPSRLSLAAALPEPKDAIEQYRIVLQSKPDYLAARLALAGLLAKTGDSTAALGQLREAQRLDQKNAEIFERIGDLESGEKHAAEARAAYESALANVQDSQAKKRIRKKLAQ